MGSLRLILAFGAVALAGGCETAVPTVAKVPQAGYAMTSAKAEHAAYAADSTVISRNSNTNCVTQFYRAADGSARAKSACPGQAESRNQGRWSFPDDGSHCVSYNDARWKGGCSAWTHVGNGRFTWRTLSGDPASGEAEVVQGNPFGL